MHPYSSPGRKLLAHELTHVVQQQLQEAPDIIYRAPKDATWKEVITPRGKLESYTDRRGAKRVLEKLKEENPDIKYRIVERGGNYIIQSRPVQKAPSDIERHTPEFKPPRENWVLVKLEKKGKKGRWKRRNSYLLGCQIIK